MTESSAADPSSSHRHTPTPSTASSASASASASASSPSPELPAQTIHNTATKNTDNNAAGSSRAQETDAAAESAGGGSLLVLASEHRPRAYQVPIDVDRNAHEMEPKSGEKEEEEEEGTNHNNPTNNDATAATRNANNNPNQNQSFPFRRPQQHFPIQPISISPLEEYALPPPPPLAYGERSSSGCSNSRKSIPEDYTGSSYHAMDDNGPILIPTKNANNNHNSNNLNQKPNNTNSNDSSRSTLHYSSSSRAARWFALETTPEDRLSLHIIQTELKTVLSELLHFAKNRHWKKKVVTVAVMVLSCLVFIDLVFLGHIRNWLNAFMIWMTEYPVHAEFAFIGIFVLATLLFVPPTLLLVGAGWAFAKAVGMMTGILAAVVSCFLGSVIGSLLSFVRARYMMRDLIELFAKRYPIVRAADQALKRDGFRIMLLLRLCPLIPFHGLNYLGGITGLSWETFLCSLVGMLPYQILVIVMGASAGTMHKSQEQEATDQTEAVPDGTNSYASQNIGMIIVTSAGVATFLIAMILAFRFTKKELQKELNIGDGEMESYITTVRRMSHIDFYDEEQVSKEMEVEAQNDNKQDPYPQTAIQSNINTEDADDKEEDVPEPGINRFVLCPTFIPK